jgi:proton glutamate symport protein
MLTSKGVAAVPRASLVILAGTLSTFNLPLSGIALILGVDTIMDMGRTAVNIIGNCLACLVMARWENCLGVQAAAPQEELASHPELNLATKFEHIDFAPAQADEPELATIGGATTSAGTH